MTTGQTDADVSVVNRLEGGLLVAIGLTYLASGVTHWGGSGTYSLPAGVDLLGGLGLLLWAVSLWRQASESTASPTAEDQ